MAPNTHTRRNHMGHALLIKLLLPTLLRTAKDGADVRIVITTSEGFAIASGLPFAQLKTDQNMWFFGPWIRYGQSKLANILYTQQLALHYPGIKTVAIHPGVINTGLVSGLSWGHNLFVWATTWWQQVSVADGVRNGIWAGIAREGGKSGGFYVPVGKLGGTTRASRDEKLAGELWEWTERELEGWRL